MLGLTTRGPRSTVELHSTEDLRAKELLARYNLVVHGAWLCFAQAPAQFDSSREPRTRLGQRFVRMMLAYFTTEAVMPVLSVIAAALGTAMVFNRYLLLYGRVLAAWVRPHSRRR